MSATLDNIEKIKHYSAYQERSHKEVRQKLLELTIYGQDLENTICMLIEENFLNEERFARALTRGKFKLKKWGRTKIKHALHQHQISAHCVMKAMTEIEEDDYVRAFDTLAEKKWTELKSERSKFTKMAKLKNYLLQKGYEYEYINTFLKNKFEP